MATRLVNRVRGQFVEMPGLKLTLAQACRLCGAREDVMVEALAALVAEGVLFRTPSGAYIAAPAPERARKVTTRRLLAG